MVMYPFEAPIKYFLFFRWIIFSKPEAPFRSVSEIETLLTFGLLLNLPGVKNRILCFEKDHNLLLSLS
jgi:hypothetical protein